MVSVERARNVLPEESTEAFDKIVSQDILGASNHIKMIGEMMESIVHHALECNEDSITLIDRIRTLTDYFIQTRGEASQAVSNAIYIMRNGFDQMESTNDIEEIGRNIISQKNSYRDTAQEAIEVAVSHAITMSKKYDSIFLYDYSSTVDLYIERLDRPRSIYIAESRIINGGQPFLKTAIEAGHNVKFIPDSAMYYYLKKCDVALMGAETFYPDGTAFNTTGSDMVGILCKHLEIPLYFLTPMIKVDVRSIFGEYKEIVMSDVEEVLSVVVKDELDLASLDFKVPELLAVDAKYITGFVTEFGIIPSHGIYDFSIKYSKSIRGEKNV